MTDLLSEAFYLRDNLRGYKGLKLYVRYAEAFMCLMRVV